ncbi:MAG: glycosyltransferase family 2 protein [Ignavibacteria bacterium]|nr:glycosyltransferase family 2 protein [Ignavibacteria bacterium]
MPSISVVIPNYNGKHLLEEYLPTVVAALDSIAVDHEIIVADDASTDGSVEFIRLQYPTVRVVVNTENKGFSGNINSGFRVATKDLVLALNSDVALDINYFVDQLPLFEDPLLFGTMGSIYEADGRLIDAAKLPVYDGFSLNSTVNATYPIEPNVVRTTFFLSGANALMDRRKLLELGGMNEIYSPFYMEDVDLSVRAWRRGWKCLYVPTSKCTHAPSSTIAASSPSDRVRIVSRCNKMLFHLFHLEGASLLRYQIYLATNYLLRWAFGDKQWYKALERMHTLLPQLNHMKREFKTTNPQSLIEARKHMMEGLPAAARRTF